MSPLLIGLVTLCYLGVMLQEWVYGSRSMAIVFAGYSLANVGLIWSLWR